MVDARTGRLPEIARDLLARDFNHLVEAAAELDDPSFKVLHLLEDEV
jgi:hypothetical protein